MTANPAQLVALLAAGTLSIVVFTALLGRREAPGARPFMVLAAGVAIWAIASALLLIKPVGFLLLAFLTGHRARRCWFGSYLRRASSTWSRSLVIW